MDTRRALALLEDHQAALLSLIGGAHAMLDLSPEDARLELARLRWEALRRLRAYQIFKHGEIFDPLLASGSVDQRRAAGRMKERCLAMGERFVRYVNRWGIDDAAAEWDEYRIAVRLMTDALMKHIAEERRDVPQLLVDTGSIRQPRRTAPPEQQALR